MFFIDYSDKIILNIIIIIEQSMNYMKLIIKIVIIILFFFNIQMYLFSNEKSSESEIKENKTNIKFNFNSAAGSKSEKIEDATIQWNMNIARGYLTMGIFGIIIAAVLGPGGAAGVFIAVARPVSGGIFGMFLSVLAVIGGLFLAALTAAVLIACGVIMAVAGFNMYNKYKKSKQPDPFLEFDNEKNDLSMGFKINI